MTIRQIAYCPEFERKKLRRLLGGHQLEKLANFDLACCGAKRRLEGFLPCSKTTAFSFGLKRETHRRAPESKKRTATSYVASMEGQTNARETDCHET